MIPNTRRHISYYYYYYYYHYYHHHRRRRRCWLSAVHRTLSGTSLQTPDYHNGRRNKQGDEIFGFLGCCAALESSWMPTFRELLLIPSS